MQKSGRPSGRERKDDEEDALQESGDIKLEVMRLIIEKISGRKVVVGAADLPDEEDRAEAQSNSEELAAQASGRDSPPPEAQQPQGWGLEYERTEIHTEAESSSFSSSGIIRTADGKDIAFDVSLQMSREKVEVLHFALRAGDATRPVDPLVVNFAGNAAALTGEKIDFDLNADGNSERIAFVASGSGFLVLDRDRDGAVDNGSELFGPTTGDGFAELAHFDEDKNGWIDEADSIYDQLSVWTGRSRESGDVLLSLKQAKVGAISLMSARTPFVLEALGGQAAGVVRATGVYLDEEGGAGTVQQIDFLV